MMAALVLFWPVVAAAGRRLHDTGRSATWLWLGLVPGLNLVLLPMLLAAPQQRPSIYDRGDDNPIGPALVGAVACLLALLLVFAVPVQVPRAGMKPALRPGDIVLVWRRGAGGWANASCWPAKCLTKSGHMPEMGTVLAIRNKDNRVSFARVVAGPGDVVSITNGRLQINANPVQTARVGTFTEPFGAQGPQQILPRCANGAVGLGAACQKPALRETLGNGAAYLILDSGHSALDRFGPVTIPEETVFVLADNRDVPEDSRIAISTGGLGFVAQSDIIGRPARILISARGASPWAVWTWRWTRILERIT